MILGITLARAGSKGVPGKNIKPIAGKPLIAWTIESALKAKQLDSYVVSTESSEIAQVAQQYGAAVAMRPDWLARDETETLEVLQYILKTVAAETIVVLQATSPVRNSGLIDACIAKFRETEADSLATGWLCHYQAYGSSTSNRQVRKGFFYDDGNLYIFKARNIRDGNPYGEKHELVMLDKEQNIDIDDAFDFWLAEQVLLKRKFQASSKTE